MTSTFLSTCNSANPLCMSRHRSHSYEPGLLPLQRPTCLLISTETATAYTSHISLALIDYIASPVLRLSTYLLFNSP